MFKSSIPHIMLLGALLTGATTFVSAQRQEKPGKEVEAKRPKINMRVQPQVVIAPAKVLVSVELVGGDDDFEEYYCPSIEWEWGDDTSSESQADCQPYEAGKSFIKRRYTTQHEFRRAGNYKLYFHLKQKDRVLGSGSTNLQVQPGLGAY
jgi:hypothetical protein